MALTLLSIIVWNDNNCIHFDVQRKKERKNSESIKK